MTRKGACLERRKTPCFPCRYKCGMELRNNWWILRNSLVLGIAVLLVVSNTSSRVDAFSVPTTTASRETRTTTVLSLSPTVAFQSTAPLRRWSLSSSSSSSSSSSLSASDGATDSSSTTPSGSKVLLVVGGTGGVGQLVTKKMRQRIQMASTNSVDAAAAAGFDQVRITARSKARGEETIDDPAVQVMEVDLVAATKAATEANASTDPITAVEKAVQGVSAMVIAVGTTAFPTKAWANGNTPKAIDEEAVKTLIQIASKQPTLQQVILVTSVGIERTNQMPFLFLNLCGVLDAKSAGERALQEAAQANGFSYVIVRPGRLVGGPFTNLDVAQLLQVEGGASNGVSLAPGDSLIGDCKRDACAEGIVQCLLHPESCRNLAFSIVSNQEKALTEPQWIEALQNLQQQPA